MSQLEMAMAVNGSAHAHSAPQQAPENCWSTTGWEPHQNLTEPTTSMEGSGSGGDYGSGRMAEWELKANAWEWENLTMVYPRQGERMQQQLSNDWASSAVTLATSASKTGDFSIGLGSGCSTPSNTSVSSGIPGVSAGKGSTTAEVKSEPDVERTVLGTPSSLSAQKDRLFFSLGGVPNEERPVEKDGGQADIGLKLGRRTYFEDSSGGQAKISSTPSLSSPPGSKKPRVMSPGTQIARCQVEGCKADLSGCKDYHRRHKVCEMHSKAPKAIAAGIEQRFCQQCSRFHVLTEFDEGKRSCRRRLAGHNERRRKPHPETHSVFGLRNTHSDTSSLTMESAPFYFLDSKRSNFLHRHRGSSLEADFHPYNTDVKRTNPWSMIRRDDTSLACQLQAASAERQSIFSTMSRPTADRLLMLLQNPKTQMAAPNAAASAGMNVGGTQFLEGPLGPLGQGLSLSSSTGGVLGSLEQQQQQQQQQQSRIIGGGNGGGSCSQSLSSVSGMSNSGRALSLLSSQSWAPRPPVVVVPADASDSTLEQLVASSSDSSNRPRFSHLQQLPSAGGSPTSTQQHPHPQFDTTTNNNHHNNNNNNNSNKQFSLQPGCLDSVRLLTNNNHNILTELGGYDETNSMLALVQAGQELQTLTNNNSSAVSPTSHQALQTIDLMQTPHSHVSNNNSHYNGYSSLRPFESSIFSSQ